MKSKIKLNPQEIAKWLKATGTPIHPALKRKLEELDKKER